MFPCSGCGLCCQNISNIQELKHYDLGNGMCKYFDMSSNECMIYNNRPEICQIDKMYEIKYRTSYKKQEFYALNAQVCNTLQEKCNKDKKYRINLGE